jgi:hypothetical protein
MEIIRECVEGLNSTRFIVRADCLNSQLCFFLALFAEAQKDFPDLRTEDVEVKQYAGRFRARMFGLEFTRKGVPVPKTYSRIKHALMTM